MTHSRTPRGLAATAPLALALLAGCAGDSPKTYPVSGRVATNGDAAALAGHHVEAALEGDPGVRASGVIGSDGSFTLRTLHGGAVLDGAREGKYRVRILRADEDADGKRLQKPPVADRFLKFETSGLSLSVPADGEVTLTVSPR